MGQAPQLDMPPRNQAFATNNYDTGPVAATYDVEQQGPQVYGSPQGYSWGNDFHQTHNNTCNNREMFVTVTADADQLDASIILLTSSFQLETQLGALWLSAGATAAAVVFNLY
jgi:hypothetical protein